ncbi:MAG: hypothetical protein HC905_09930 [Bacteroidales bacterium]|nr:hypothetical protein [Bacteroidales bacterium]
MKSQENIWLYNNLTVILGQKNGFTEVVIHAPKEILCDITLTWKIAVPESSRVLNDHWERTYGDVSWHKPKTSEILPWYFMEITEKEEINRGELTIQRYQSIINL